MSAYLYPNLGSKKAYREAIAKGEAIVAKEQTPWGEEPVENGSCTFEGPHYPQPHKFYGQATVKNGHVTKVK